MPDSDIDPKARKHTRITLDVRLLAMEILPDCDVYMATYPAGGDYQREEERSGKEFWSIKAYEHEPSRETHVKDLDVIIVEGNRVRFMIEVKWGIVPGGTKTDLLLSADELNKMTRLMASPAVCRVRGPAVKDGRRYRSEEFPVVKRYDTDSETRLILVSDFKRIEKVMPTEFSQFLSLARRMKETFQPADSESRVDDIPSLQEILEATSQT